MKSIWKVNPDVEILNSMNKNTLVEHLGIEITEVGPDFIKAKMPVDERTKQPLGLLHGGASCVLSESIGSIASVLIVENPLLETIVGVEINATHIKSVKSGYVYSTTKPIKIGNKIQVWNTEIHNEKDDLICISRLTTMKIKNRTS